MAIPVAARPQITSEELSNQLAQIVGAERVLTRPIDLVAWASDAGFYQAAAPGRGACRQHRGGLAASSSSAICMAFPSPSARPAPARAARPSATGCWWRWHATSARPRCWAGANNCASSPASLAPTPTACWCPTAPRSAPTRPPLPPAPSAASSATTPAACAAAWSRTPTTRWPPLNSCCPRARRLTPPPPDADQLFHAREPELARGVLELRQRILNDEKLAGRIRSKYRMKNTTGYGLNAFVDFERAVDIFRHLLIGAEGTLAFLAEATLQHRARPAGEVHRAAAVSGSLRRQRQHCAPAPGRRQGPGDHGPGRPSLH